MDRSDGSRSGFSRFQLCRQERPICKRSIPRKTLAGASTDANQVQLEKPKIRMPPIFCKAWKQVVHLQSKLRPWML